MLTSQIKIGNKIIGKNQPAYIIAEVGSNFDGSLVRAKKLAKLAKDCGADAYKIQNFLAPKIVSSEGFKNLQIAFQAKWNKPVIETYRQAEFPRKWLRELSDYCQKIDIDFLSSPYDTEAVDLLEKIKIPAYKIGSGEIDNLQFLQYIAKKNKPIILGCGAATIKEIREAVDTIRQTNNNKIILLQCVTNYPSPIRDSNIRAMQTIQDKFKVLVGYSDHTIGKSGKGDDPLDGLTVPLGAVALGAVVIEKHFTDDTTRQGPDHPFAMSTEGFKKMVRGIRSMEQAIGNGKKEVMSSEQETVIIQRRGIYASKDIEKGEKISLAKVEFLRPATYLRPPQLNKVIGKKANLKIFAGEPIKLANLI